jgi:hypothetical protein
MATKTSKTETVTIRISGEHLAAVKALPHPITLSSLVRVLLSDFFDGLGQRRLYIEVMDEALRATAAPKATAFKPGYTPWNCGVNTKCQTSKNPPAQLKISLNSLQPNQPYSQE